MTITINTDIFNRLYNLLCFWYSHTKKIPKFDRYTIAQKIFDILLETLLIIQQAQFQKPYQKKLTLEKASQSLGTVKILIRLTHDLNIVDQKKYLYLEKNLQEIGCMLGGWIKSLSENKRG